MLTSNFSNQKIVNEWAFTKINNDYKFYIKINMTVWILARKEINFSMAAGLIRLHIPGVK